MSDSSSKPHVINEGHRIFVNDGKTIGERGQNIPRKQSNPTPPPPPPAPKK